MRRRHKLSQKVGEKGERGREGENNKEKFSSRVEAGKSSDWLISDMGSDGLAGLRIGICGRSHTESLKVLELLILMMLEMT